MCRFDSEPKRYRFKASLAFQLATVCELLTPLVPGMFLVLASTANIGIFGKNVGKVIVSKEYCLVDDERM